LVRPLGRGGMGEVWEATHIITRRPVALKRLLHTLNSHPDGLARARFVLEAQTACAVEHPNVVEILDFMEGGTEPPVIVMELLHGETLAARLSREHALPLDETARVLLPVVSAVGTAHCRGIIHRDLKPANVFLSRKGGSEPVVKVLDFGIAKWVVLDAGESALRTQTGSTLGTPCYMAPEQAIGDRMVDHRVDIWSLGVIFYECLSGARPVEGENAAHMVMRLLSTGIIPIEQLVPTLPRNLAELIGRMLSREPAQRPEDLREVCAALAPLGRVSVPPFAEPRVQSLSPSNEPLKSAERSAPPVSREAKTPFAGEGDRGVIDKEAPFDRRRTRTRPGRWLLLGASMALGGVAIGAAQRFYSPRPGTAPTSAAAAPVREIPMAAVEAKAEPPAHPEPVPGNSPPSETPTASVLPRGPPPQSLRWIPPLKPPTAPSAPMSAATAPSLEPTKPVPAPSNPLDIELQ
jgi:eukaryotic-like serine/threonine-protein kinase